MTKMMKSMKLISFIVLYLLALSALANASESQSEYYANESANIEFRAIVETEDTPWLYMQDLEGTSHKVSKKIVLGSMDVEGITVESDRVVMHFKLTSWKKVRERTGQLLKKKVAVIHDGEILMAPIIHEPLTRSAVITSGSKGHFNKVLKGSVPAARPLLLDSYEEYIRFLLEWITTHPNELDEKQNLANYYLNTKKPPQFENALPPYHELARKKPNYSMVQIGLVSCFVGLEQLDQALSTAKGAISNLDSLGKTFMYNFIGEIFFAKGEKEQALENLKIYLNRIKQIKYPESFLTKELESTKNPFSTDMQFKKKIIKEIEDRIEFIKSN